MTEEELESVLKRVTERPDIIDVEGKVLVFRFDSDSMSRIQFEHLREFIDDVSNRLDVTALALPSDVESVKAFDTSQIKKKLQSFIDTLGDEE